MRKHHKIAITTLILNCLIILLIIFTNLSITPALASGEYQISDNNQINPTPTPTSEIDQNSELDSPIILYPAPLALDPNDHFYFTRPVAVESGGWNSSNFEYGIGNEDPSSPHTGLDIKLPIGTSIYAAGSGTVVWAGYGLYLSSKDSNDPYGFAIAIRHDFGYKGETLYTVYGHLSQINVRRGQKVEMGQLIGLSGNTGISTAPHLHYEVRLGLNDFFSSVNPELWTVPPEGTGVLVGRMTTTIGQKLLGQEIAIKNLTTGITTYDRSYTSTEIIGSDSYYDENIVFSDLEAGEYRIYVPYVGYEFYLWVTVRPGTITYFNLNGLYGLLSQLPYIPLPSNLPIQ